MLLVVAAVGGPILLSSILDADPPRLSGTPPYRIPSALGTTIAGAPWDPGRHLGGPAALLYVSDRCPHCLAELRVWDSLKGSDGSIRLWIVASPQSERETLRWVPPRLRPRVVADGEGRIAEALGVRAVPATLFVDAGGIVRDQWLGRSSPAGLQEAIRRITGAASQKEARDTPDHSPTPEDSHDPRL